MNAVILAFLELTFVMASILLLHSLKDTIGAAPFYLTLAMFLVMGQIVTSAGIHVVAFDGKFTLDVGHAALLSPFMVAILLVYIIDGTLETQRLILGFLVILLGYFYLASITAYQCNWSGYSTAIANADTHLSRLFLRGRRVVAASFVSHAIDFFTLPLIFQIFRNWKLRIFYCVLGTLIFAQVIDAFLFHLLTSTGGGDWWQRLSAIYFPRAAAMAWLSVLLTIYLKMCRIAPVGEKRRPLDVIVAFFGGYSKARKLEKNIKEWEGRYEVIVQQSADLIFVIDPAGQILTVNNAVLLALNKKPAELAFTSIHDWIMRSDNHIFAWENVWHELVKNLESTTIKPVIKREWKAKGKSDEEIFLDAHISIVEFAGRTAAMVVARNFTERRKMEQERKELQEQLVHSQRLEAIGQLAGGIAHDFNNLLHTIQGNLDRLVKTADVSDKQRSLLDCIAQAGDRASSLTSQLLGFARKGKYRMQRIEVAGLINQTKTLFEPVAGKTIKLKVIISPNPMYIKGDATQLQQVFLNLLLNARDAISESEKPGRIVFRAEPVEQFFPGWNQRAEASLKAKDFLCIRIKDNGCGIPEDIRGKIFDPFFTTKAIGKGTGMGLSMAYGCIMNHHGWIHLESAPGKGSEFCIYLPTS